ncbi:hypothetical protein H0H92_012732 [Tricholoma furcatifolium]|nr:hypothetical protein H0H92_012732 [Tricholoma furcatifolium]
MNLPEGDLKWSTIPVVVDSTQAEHVHASQSRTYLGPVKCKKKTKSWLINHRPTTLEAEDKDMQSDSNNSHGVDEDHPPCKHAKLRNPLPNCPQSESGPQPAGSQRTPPPDAPVGRSSAPSGAGQPICAAQ